DVGGLGTASRDPFLHRLGDELRSVVGPHATRRSRRGAVGPMPSWTRQRCPQCQTPGTILRLLCRRRTGLKPYAGICLGYRRSTARSSTSPTTTASPSKRLPKSLASARRP